MAWYDNFAEIWVDKDVKDRWKHTTKLVDIDRSQLSHGE